jgi:hypothetical protein
MNCCAKHDWSTYDSASRCPMCIQEERMAASPPSPASAHEDDAEKCEGCKAPATQHDVDGVPLCSECWKSNEADNAPHPGLCRCDLRPGLLCADHESRKCSKVEASAEFPGFRWWSWHDRIAHLRPFRAKGQALCGEHLSTAACYALPDDKLCADCIAAVPASPPSPASAHDPGAVCGECGCDAACRAKGGSASVPSAHEGPTERYERLAVEFYEATHIMAPGKSVPAAMGCQWTDEFRRSEWDKWLAARPTQAEEACRATWRRCAEDFDFFNEYMTEVALAGHGAGQESQTAEVRALVEAASLLFEHLTNRSAHSLPGNLTLDQALRKVAAFNVDAEDLRALRAALVALEGKP